MNFSRITTSLIICNLITFGHSKENEAEKQILISSQGKVYYSSISKDDRNVELQTFNSEDNHNNDQNGDLITYKKQLEKEDKVKVVNKMMHEAQLQLEERAPKLLEQRDTLKTVDLVNKNKEIKRYKNEDLNPDDPASVQGLRKLEEEKSKIERDIERLSGFEIYLTFKNERNSQTKSWFSYFG